MPTIYDVEVGKTGKLKKYYVKGVAIVYCYWGGGGYFTKQTLVLFFFQFLNVCYH